MPLSGTNVFITGASAGIGTACARALAAAGAHLVLAARRRDRLETLAAELKEEHGAETLIVELDVRDAASIDRAVAGLPEAWREVDVLINNAGLGRGLEPMHEGDPEEWEEMIGTNVTGLLRITRALLPGMIERGRGQVVNLGSTAGHEVYPGGTVYCATKHAVRAITQGLRHDLLGTPIRVSSVDPGMVETEFSVVRFRGDRERADAVYAGMQPLTPEDIAEIVLFCVTRPPHVSIDHIVVKPTAQASSTRVARREGGGASGENKA
jgi:3-hydroxy acid dehydrogenase / malonic semialdehyde reductase